MGVAAPRAPVGGRGSEPPKRSVTGHSCYLEIKSHKKNTQYAQFGSVLSVEIKSVSYPRI